MLRKTNLPVLATDASSDLAKLARKTVVGSTIMMLSTIVNLAVLLRFHGEEAGWVCLLICTIDGKTTLICLENRANCIRYSNCRSIYDSLGH